MATKAVQLCLLIAEIDELKQCMIERYEQSGCLRDPFLMQLSEIVDQKLNRLHELQKMTSTA